jgi:hypothetical protein
MKRDRKISELRQSPYSEAFSPMVQMILFSLFGFFGNLIFILFSQIAGMQTLEILGITLKSLTSAFFVFILYFACWTFGYFVSLNSKKYHRPSMVCNGFRFGRGALFLICLASIFILWVAYLKHPSAGEAFRSSLTEGSYGKFFFLLMSFVFAMYGLFSAKLIRDYLKSDLNFPSLIRILIPWGIVTFFLLVVLVSLGGRGRSITCLIMMAAIWHYNLKPISLKMVALLSTSAIVMAVLLPALVDANHGVKSSIIAQLWGVSNGRTFDGLYNLTKIIEWWSQNGRWGGFGELWVGDILGDLGFSNLFSTRDAVMISVYGKFDFSAGFPATKPGELLLNFGFFGIIWGGVLFGYLSGQLYTLCVVRRYFDIASIPIYIFTLFRLGIASPLGYFAQNIVLSLATFILILLCCMFFFGGYKFRLIPFRHLKS